MNYEMALLLGYIEEFIEGCKQWPQYVEWLKYFLAANGYTNADRIRDIFALPKVPLGRALSYHKQEAGCIYVNNAGP